MWGEEEEERNYGCDKQQGPDFGFLRTGLSRAVDNNRNPRETALTSGFELNCEDVNSVLHNQGVSLVNIRPWFQKRFQKLWQVNT